MADRGGTPLEGIPGWSDAHIRKLASHWITTAEQVVGAAVSSQGLSSLAHDLGVSLPEMSKLVERARAALHPDVAKDLEKPVDTSQYGFGAMPPKDEN